jgi:hypothetical protein
LGKPIHQLLKENNGTIFFHGHDHLFAKQDKDNIVYQEVPQPSAKNLSTLTGTEPGYGYSNGLLLTNRGYLYVTVAPDSIKIDYIKIYLPSEENANRHNGEIAYSYTIKSSPIGNQLINQALVQVFPNPTHTSIKVVFNENVINFRLTVFNNAGQPVLRPTLKEFDVSRLPAGIYYLNIQTDKFQMSKKIVLTN